MSLSSALGAGVGALSANATRLAATSDNIANASTDGFKRMEADFNSFVIGSGGGSYSAGGVRPTIFREISSEQSLLLSSNAMDIAVDGAGFLPVTDISDLEKDPATRELMLTRTGGFRKDSNGVMKTPSGLVLMGWPASAAGTIPSQPRETVVGLTPVTIPSNPAASPTTQINLGVSLPANATLLTADRSALAEEQKVPFYPATYIGNLGNSETLEFHYTPKATPLIAGSASRRSNTWTIEVKDLASGTAVTKARFDVQFSDEKESAGLIKSVIMDAQSPATYATETGKVTLQVQGGSIDVFIGKPEDTNSALRQLAGAYAPTNVVSDGSSVGIISSWKIDDSGYVIATYDTGESKILYQVPLATVPNPNGMVSGSAQTFKISRESGRYFLWDAGDGPTGKVQGFAKEASATDIAGELTDMIQTQRAYSSNAKIIQTVDEMMQEAANLKR